MDDLFHKILIHLYDRNALHQDTDITYFLKSALGQDYNNVETLMNLRETLGRLKNSGFIKISKLPLFGQPGNGSATNNLDEHNMIASLELLGHNYIFEKIRLLNQDSLLAKQTVVAEKTGDSVVSTNDFTVTNAKKNNRLFWLTFAVAVISAAGTVGGFILSYRQQIQTQKQVSQDTSLSQMQNQLLRLNNALSVQQQTIDSLRSSLVETKVDDTIKSNKP